MRFSTALVVLSVAFTTTSAALLGTRQDGYADCAIPCLTSTDPGSCSLSDTSCLCRDQQFIDGTTLCFQSSCTGADLTNSLATADEMCRSVGVTLTSSVSGPTSTSLGPASTRSNPSSTSSSPASSSSSSGSNSAGSNGVNVLFTLSALGLIGCAL